MFNPFHFDFAGTAQKLRDIRDFGGEVVITFSVLANFLPKIEAVTNPAAKRVVAITTAIVSFFALNWRKHLRQGEPHHDNIT
jgi:hypothetical protein